MLSKGAILFAAAVFSGLAWGQSLKDDIYTLAGDIRSEVHSSRASSSALERARADLRSALSLVRDGDGGGGGGDELYCRRIRDTDYYAPARVSDGEWMQDNGTSLATCRNQIRSANYGLFCSRIRETDYYAPMLVASKTWRGEHGTTLATCDRQLLGARSGIFCQRIRETDYYAPARISTGAWLQDNGVSLEQCVSSLGGLTRRTLSERVIVEPAIPERVVVPVQ